MVFNRNFVFIYLFVVVFFLPFFLHIGELNIAEKMIFFYITLSRT